MQRIYDTTKITPEEIISLVKEMTRRREEGENVGYETAVFILCQRYDRNDQEQHDKAFVIMQRLDCLTKLTNANDNRMRGWTLEGKEEGCLFSNEAVFRATALCRIRRKDGHAYFDPDEFFDLVLMESEPDGSVN
jgi:hypothetical protein